MGIDKKLKKKISVQVTRSNQSAISVDIKEGETVAHALDAAGMHLKDTESIRVNQKEAKIDTKLKNGDRIVLAKNIAGGAV